MKLIFITNSFPYHPGEQFIESEIDYLGKSSFSPITILPLSAVGEPRRCPERFRVDLALAKHKKKSRHLIKAFLSPLLFGELNYLWNKGTLCRRTALQALRAVVATIRLSDGLAAWLKKNGKVDTAYVYWNDVGAYAACLAKRKNLIDKVVSRSHRYDAYEEQRPYAYMPLKRQFLNSFDKIFLLSEQAREYYQARYGFDKSVLEVSPLGVFVPFSMSKTTANEEFHLVSVSFCVPVKRVEKIIKGIHLLALAMPSLKIRWTHIGDGPLRESLVAMGKSVFFDTRNVSFDFKGSLQNSEVTAFYQDCAVDVFINLSESEGIPVSIMEAMAAGVPAIATSVGGVPDLVEPANGCLLSADPTLEEIKVALIQMVIKSKDIKTRHSARDKIVKRFNAPINYRCFVTELEKIGAERRRMVG